MAQVILSPLAKLPEDLKSLLEKYHQNPIIQEIWIHELDRKALYGYLFNQYNLIVQLKNPKVIKQ